jgi:dynactin 1
MKELNDKLQHQENELKDTRDKFSAYRDEMNDTEIRIESLTLDLEMAEEKLETITLENTTLKEKYEEAQLELDIIKGEIQLNGPNQVANGIQKKIDDERTIKMEQALIKLRDLSVTKQAENDKLTKQSEILEHKIKVLTKETENAKIDITNMQATIADLKEQVDTCLGAQQMVEILTNKNLSLEDQVRELQETADNLVS